MSQAGGHFKYGTGQKITRCRRGDHLYLVPHSSANRSASTLSPSTAVKIPTTRLSSVATTAQLQHHKKIQPQSDENSSLLDRASV